MLPNLQYSASLVTFTEEILDGKLYFCAVYWKHQNTVWNFFKDFLDLNKLEQH